jgi:hypothetical protein
MTDEATDTIIDLLGYNDAAKIVPDPDELIIAPDGFLLPPKVDGSGIPIVLDHGEVSEPAIAFFYHRRVYHGAPSSTLLSEGRILREWFRWAEANGRTWDSPSDYLLASWAQAQSGNGVGATRIDRKSHFIFGFYLLLQETGFLGQAGIRDLVGVGEFPVRAERVELIGKGGKPHIVLRPAFVKHLHLVETDTTRRHVPTAAEVEVVFQRLLKDGTAYCHVRNWLCANWMAEVGLRRQGTSSLTVESIEKALDQAKIKLPIPETAAEREAAVEQGWNPLLPGLASMSRWLEGQRRLLDEIRTNLVDRHREHVFVSVVEKRNKRRTVMVPIPLLITTIQHWIWDHRARFIDETRKRHRDWMPSAALWFSEKTFDAMTAPAIGNAVKAAFTGADGEEPIKGSGHRLRAFYLSSLVRKLYQKARATGTVDVQTILTHACELAGHKNRETLKFYLHQEMGAGMHLPGQAIIVTIQDDAELLRGIAEALNDGSAASTTAAERAKAEDLKKILLHVAESFGIDRIPEPGSPATAQALLGKMQRRTAPEM